MIWAYRIGLYIAIPFAIIGLIMRGFRNRLYWLRWGERFGFIAPEIKQAAPFDLWIHAVSVGEVRAAVPLVDRLISEQPDISILLTSTTPTGSEMCIRDRAWEYRADPQPGSLEAELLSEYLIKRDWLT